MSHRSPTECLEFAVKRAGATAREVMDRPGHTTTTRYQHVAASRADALAERLSALAGS